jgi:hypothetical protein
MEASTKDGWNDAGITCFQELITCFQELMQKVRDNSANTKGAEFDKLVQQKMKQEASGRGRRKHCHGLEETKSW